MPYTEVQTIEAFGGQYTEYRYEPDFEPDDEPLMTPLVCAQCDYFQSGSQLSKGVCALLGKARLSSNLACPHVVVTAPF